jgi:hypothetical protein
MFAAASHPFYVQAIALWLSFVPAFSVIALIGGAQIEAVRRSAWFLKRSCNEKRFETCNPR